MYPISTFWCYTGSWFSHVASQQFDLSVGSGNAQMQRVVKTMSYLVKPQADPRAGWLLFTDDFIWIYDDLILILFDWIANTKELEKNKGSINIETEFCGACIPWYPLISKFFLSHSSFWLVLMLNKHVEACKFGNLKSLNRATGATWTGRERQRPNASRGQSYVTALHQELQTDTSWDWRINTLIAQAQQGLVVLIPDVVLRGEIEIHWGERFFFTYC
jgi:hypothetical protein